MKEQKWGKNNDFYYIPNLEHHCCTVYKVSFFVSKKQQLLGYYCILQLKTLQAVIINKVEFLTYEHHSARFPQNMIRIPIRKEITLDSNLKLAAFPMRILNSWWTASASPTGILRGKVKRFHKMYYKRPLHKLLPSEFW